MAKITPKDNLMRLVGGGHPEYVPVYTMMGEPYLGEAADVFINAPIFKVLLLISGNGLEESTAIGVSTG